MGDVTLSISALLKTHTDRSVSFDHETGQNTAKGHRVAKETKSEILRAIREQGEREGGKEGLPLGTSLR